MSQYDAEVIFEPPLTELEDCEGCRETDSVAGDVGTAEVYEPAAAERAYGLAMKAEERVGDGDFITGVAMMEEALRINPELRLTNQMQYIWGMACYGSGDLAAAADRLIAFSESILAQVHRDRDNAARVMNEMGSLFLGVDPQLAKKLFKQSGLIAESAMERMRAAAGLAIALADSSPHKAAKVATEALHDDGWKLHEEYVKEMMRIRKSLEKLSNLPEKAHSEDVI